MIWAQTDGAVFQKIQEPGFGQWVVYLLVFLIVVDRVRGWFVPGLRQISGKLVTTPEKQLATQEEVVSLKGELDSFIEQNRAEHQNAITEGQRRVVNLSEVLATETSEIEQAMDRLRETLSSRMDNAFTLLHQKIDPLVAHSAGAAALIDQIDKRLSRLESDHNEAVKNLNSRIDDALRTALTKK